MGDLDAILLTFESALTSNLSAVQALVKPTFYILMTIDLVWGALLGLMDGRTSFIPFIVNKIMRYGFFMWLFNNYDWIINSIIDSFSMIGAVIGGDNTSIIQSPSIMIDKCYSLVNPIWIHATENSMSIMNLNIGQFFTLCVVMFFICLAFFIMVIQAVVTYLEFYIVSVFAMIMIPFGVNKYTSFLTEKAIGAIPAIGIKIAVLQVILSISCTVLNGLAVDVINDNLQSYMVLCCSCLICAFLSWQAPAIVSGFLSGAPSLTAAGAASNFIGGTNTVVSSYSMAKNGVKDIRSKSLSAVAAASHLANKFRK